MRKTTKQVNNDGALAVDIKGLMNILGCGERTARIIAEQANARIPITTKRTLYSVDRIREYINHTTQKEE